MRNVRLWMRAENQCHTQIPMDYFICLFIIISIIAIALITMHLLLSMRLNISLLFLQSTDESKIQGPNANRSFIFLIFAHVLSDDLLVVIQWMPVLSEHEHV